MAYTIEITDGSTTYTLGTSPNVGGRFLPSFSYEENRSRQPPVRTVEIETWVLDEVTYIGADAAATGDFETLRAILAARSSPTSVKFKRDSTTVREINTTTHKGGVFAQALEVKDNPGLWATHWQGRIVVYGRRLFADGANIVHFEREALAYSYDAAGLAIVTSRGKLTTIPGTSAETQARAQALTSPGATYGLVTQGPSGEPNVTVLDETDTSASWESIWKQHGESLPAGVNEWVKVVETTDVPGEGEIETTTVRAKGPTMSSLRTAVRARRPSAEVVSVSEHEDVTGRAFSATYVTKRPNESSAERTREAKIVSRRVEVAVEGLTPKDDDERDLAVDLIPGYEAAFTKMPRSPIRVIERIVARLRGVWAQVADFRLEPVLRSAGIDGLRFLPGEARIGVPALEEQALDRDGDLWRAEATYVYLATRIELSALSEHVRDQ